MLCDAYCNVKTSLASIEGKQSIAENELRQVRTNLRDYELLVEDYRTQVYISVHKIIITIMIIITRKGSTAKNCNLRLSDVSLVVVGFNYEAHNAPAYTLQNQHFYNAYFGNR